MIYLRLYEPGGSGFVVQSVDKSGNVTDCGNIISSFSYDDEEDNPLVISVCHGYNRNLGFPKKGFNADNYEAIIQ